ncbi:AlpA family transcriptional regulator [Salmonella enterica subsp. enterica serovar Enteritidis]|nr:AlpA family transcriptional regulator [Klebsiella aerogenes]EAB4195025.1 AlpA family transcriptional regulator [Salmonella enterica]EBV5759498.1 AlpA family transcriptional regulator [Salmonella enterica subsp. enterica serovar Newport]ECM0312659.1 AlpA family transcriptional regulator [Salmonella enterica subsp. enterica serovar Enteritidis]EDL3607808.1 AlpA family transcriptional regulator [Salmonella enterica subsp. enterica serovar Newport]EIT8734090.1 AlpA family transcriptional regula
MTIKPSLSEDQFVNMAFITHLTGLTDKWFYKLIKDGEFPAPIKFGRSSRWRQSEVEAWLQARIDASRGENSSLPTTHKLTVTPVETLS